MPRLIRQPAKALGVTVLALVSALAVVSTGALAHAQTTAAPSLRTPRGCYLVGQEVELRGSRFAPYRTYVVTIDGVYLGSSTSDAAGDFTVPIRPGGLPAGSPQNVDHVQVSDGTSSAQATFTLTRPVGARILTTGANPSTLKARFQLWGFSLRGAPKGVYLHYVGPTGNARRTVALGNTTGQCGYLRTSRRRLFPFSVSPGTWTLQLDTQRSYARHPSGSAARIRVGIR